MEKTQERQNQSPRFLSALKLQFGEPLAVVRSSTVLLHPEDGSDGFESVLTFSGSLVHRMDRFVLEGAVCGRVLLPCDRCLEVVPVALCATVYELYVEAYDDDHPEDDFFLLQDHGLDLDDVLLAHGQLALPMKVLCSEDCLGLCPICGSNRNEGSCDCQTPPKNAVFDGLDGLFEP